jgi:hypothetical protein
VRVRIKTAPYEREMDGLRLDRFEPGSIRDVSSSLGTWLIVKGYAEPEMRNPQSQSGDLRPHSAGPFTERRKSST